MSSEVVKAKTSEIAQTLAKDTGVKAEDVEKILNRLGIGKAIENRLAKISVNKLRIATGSLIQ